MSWSEVSQSLRLLFDFVFELFTFKLSLFNGAIAFSILDIFLLTFVIVFIAKTVRLMVE